MNKLPICPGFTNGAILLKNGETIPNVLFNGMEFVHVNETSLHNFSPDDFVRFIPNDECKLNVDRTAVLEHLKQLDPRDVVVVYHSGCPDGVTSAAVIINELGPDIQLVRGRYSSSIFESVDDLTGKVVLMADFSYPEEEMMKVIDQADLVIFLDHHKSAVETLSKQLHRAKVFCYASVFYSGASLTWDFFHNGQNTPLFVQYIEDGDLYKFELPNSYDIVKGLHAAMGELLDESCKLLDDGYFKTRMNDFLQIGQSLNQNAQRNVKNLIKNGLVKVSLNTHTFPMVNVTPDHTNLVGEVIGDMPGVPFVICYTILADKVKVSLRSGKHGEDVTMVLNDLGIQGGGHKHAGAGFIDLTTFFNFFIKKAEPYSIEMLTEENKSCECCKESA